MTNNFKAGLEGVVACKTAITDIDAGKGLLIFRGSKAEELVQTKSYEQILYHLLLGGDTTTISEEAFVRKMRDHFTLTKSEIALLVSLRTGVPMRDFRTALSALAAKRSFDSWLGRKVHQVILNEGLALVALAPKIAEVLRTGMPPVPKPNGIGYVEEYLWGLLGHEPSSDAVRALHLFMGMSIDHGLAASTFAARVAASTGPDMGSVFTSAAATFLGVLHGGAAEKAPEMLDAVRKPELAEPYVQAVLDDGRLLFGFGHRVYTHRDPRADTFKLASAIIGGPRYELALSVEKAAQEAFMTRKGKILPTNMDFWSGLLLESAGIPRSMFNVTFWVAREGGILAHTLEQISENRIYRPLSLYVGPDHEIQLVEP